MVRRSEKPGPIVRGLRSEVRMINNMRRFEDAIIWQRSRVLVKEIYRCFSSCRDYGFKDQIQRATVSVMNNIAEGFERKGDREMVRYFIIALGSLGETRSMLYTAEDLNYLSHEVSAKLRNDSWEIRGLMLKFMQYLKRPSPSSDLRTEPFGPSDGSNQ